MTSAWIKGGRLKRAMIAVAALLASWPAYADDGQPPVDRSDPGVAVEEVRENEAPRPIPPERPDISTDDATPAQAAQAILAGAIRIDGAVVLPQAAFAPAIEPYLGRELAPEALRHLVHDVAQTARDAGYGLATAWIPPQSLVNGVLRVRIDEGRIDAVDARGPGAAAVARRLEGLAGPTPVRTDALERALLLASDVDGVSVGRARLERAGGRNVLRVDTRFDRVRGQVTVDNWGTSSLGPVRMRAIVDIFSIATAGDRLTIGAMTTPFQPREFQFVQAGYSLPVGAGGTELSARGYLSRSGAGGSLRALDIDGDAAEIGVGLSHPIVRSRSANLWAYLDLGLRDSNLDRGGTRLRDDRIATVSASLYGWKRLGGGALRVRWSLVQGLDAFNATRQGDPRASRPDGDGVFTKASFWADYTRMIGGGFSIQIGGQGQLASRPLLASEELGLGGRAFLRGYDYREFSGDRGAAGMLELRYDLRDPAPFLNRVQLYAYGDVGEVNNLRSGFGSGWLASAGGGVRLYLPHRIEAGVELGVPLRDGFDGMRPAPRLSLTLAARF